MTNDSVNSFLSTVEKSCKDGNLINLTFSKLPSGEVQKIRVRLKKISGASLVQFEYFLTEGRVKQKNVQADSVCDELSFVLSLLPRQADFSSSVESGTLLVSKKGDARFTSKRKASQEVVFEAGNDREKNYIFDGTEDFMMLLGISDAKGRVHDKRQAKFRQINRFCEQVRDILKYLPETEAVNIADLCCGKSYLSFAVYYYLTVILKKSVSMVCIDLKQSVIDYCADIANKLGYGGMSFYCMDINDYRPKSKTHLVISLHACDVATDIVLDYAISVGARVILSTPCCQHELSGIFSCDELDFIGKYSHLKQKLCSVATDALRLERLEAAGYKTDAIELIDPEDTPKNTLLRGILKNRNFKNTPKGVEKFKAYSSHYKYLTGREAKALPNGKDDN